MRIDFPTKECHTIGAFGEQRFFGPIIKRPVFGWFDTNLFSSTSSYLLNVISDLQQYIPDVRDQERTHRFAK